MKKKKTAKELRAEREEARRMGLRLAYYVLGAHEGRRGITHDQFKMFSLFADEKLTELRSGKHEDRIIQDREVTFMDGTKEIVRPERRTIRGKKWWDVTLTGKGVLAAQELGPGRWRPYAPPKEAHVRCTHKALRRSSETPERLEAQAARKEAQAQKFYKEGEHEHGVRAEDDAETLRMHAKIMRAAGAYW